MANIDNALHTYLTDHSGLKALISGRIYFDALHQDVEYPAVIGIFISNNLDSTFSGISKLERPRIQFSSYAATRASAKLVAAQVRAALSDYRGTLSGITVQNIALMLELPTVYQSDDGLLRLFVVHQEYEVNWTNT